MISCCEKSSPIHWDSNLQPSNLTLVVCGLQPKTKELLALLFLLLLMFLFTNWIIASLKKFKWKKLSLTGNWTRVLQLPTQALYPLCNSHIVTQVVKNYLFNLRMSKTTLQKLDHYWTTLVPAIIFRAPHSWAISSGQCNRGTAVAISCL